MAWGWCCDNHVSSDSLDEFWHTGKSAATQTLCDDIAEETPTMFSQACITRCLRVAQLSTIRCNVLYLDILRSIFSKISTIHRGNATATITRPSSPLSATNNGNEPCVYSRAHYGSASFSKALQKANSSFRSTKY
jgi:hypothetical protein